MKRLDRDSRDFLVGIALALALAVVTWWFVSGLAKCPQLQVGGDLAARCHAEASQIGLRFAAVVGAFVALVTTAVVLFNRGRED